MSENSNLLALMLDVVTFRPGFARIPAGEDGEPLGALGALMLTKAVKWQVEAGEGVWFQKSLEEWRWETAMDDAEMSEARARLRETPFWKEREVSKPEPQLYVFVDLPVLADVLDDLISGR